MLYTGSLKSYRILEPITQITHITQITLGRTLTTLVPPLPVLDKPVVLAIISAIANGQNTVVKPSLRAKPGMVHPTGVELSNVNKKNKKKQDIQSKV